MMTPGMVSAIRGLEMKAAGVLDFGTDLHNPNFAQIAEAAGLLGLRAETPEEVRRTMTQALEHDGPALVEVIVSRQELSMPPTIRAAGPSATVQFTLPIG